MMMFCPHPFTDFQVDTEGDVYLCCKNWLPRSVGNVLVDDPMEIWNGPAAREIRRLTWGGDFSCCAACPHFPALVGSILGFMVALMTCTFSMVKIVKEDRESVYRDHVDNHGCIEKSFHVNEKKTGKFCEMPDGTILRGN